MDAIKEAIKEAIEKSKAYYCLECGKCTAVCPIARPYGDFSPRRMASMAITGAYEPLIEYDRLWACLTCGLCGERCPSDVSYGGFVRLVRAQARRSGFTGICSHGGTLQSLMHMMGQDRFRQKRLDWVPEDVKWKPNQGEVLYFVGCLPYFEAFFSDLGAKPLEAAKGTLRLLNRMGIEPALLEDERCCGHDLLWSGDTEGFKALARKNAELIEASGAKMIVTSCPEGLRTLKADYPKMVGLNVEVKHISEVIAEKLKEGVISFRQDGEKPVRVTYQDPCRLGRHLGIYQAPRTVMEAIPGLELREMPRSGNLAICCGTSSWMNCDITSKALQTERLKEAHETGSELLVTACPKCEIHFKCTLKDNVLGPDENLEIVDLATLAAQSLDDQT
jgi:Fe-S oxidoreductase